MWCTTDAMPDSRGASKIRQQLARLASECWNIERALLRRLRMIAASLIERHLGTREQEWKSSASYLSWAQEGRTRLLHVPKPRTRRVREQVEAWRESRAARRRWRELADAVAKLFRQLRERQAQHPGELKP